MTLEWTHGLGIPSTYEPQNGPPYNKHHVNYGQCKFMRNLKSIRTQFTNLALAMWIAKSISMFWITILTTKFQNLYKISLCWSIYPMTSFIFITMFCGTDIIPQNNLHIRTRCGDYFVEYCQFHTTLLWIWTMVCHMTSEKVAQTEGLSQVPMLTISFEINIRFDRISDFRKTWFPMHPIAKVKVIIEGIFGRKLCF